MTDIIKITSAHPCVVYILVLVCACWFILTIHDLKQTCTSFNLRLAESNDDPFHVRGVKGLGFGPPFLENTNVIRVLRSSASKYFFYHKTVIYPSNFINKIKKELF